MRNIKGLALLFLLTCIASSHAAGLSANEATLSAADAVSISLARTENTAHQAWISFSVASGVYLYKDRLQLEFFDQEGTRLDGTGKWQAPTGTLKDDDIYGSVPVIDTSFDLAIPTRLNEHKVSHLQVSYQACLEGVLCYTPQTVTLAMPSMPEMTIASSRDMSTNPDLLAVLQSNDALAFGLWMQQHSMPAVLLLFFLGGALLSLTPCVFPMIPILSGIIVGAEKPSAGRGFMLSTLYVIGMSVPYTAAGLLVATFGGSLNIQYLFQHPVSVALASVVFVVLALAMFDVYQLQLPESISSRLNTLGTSSSKGPLFNALFMGALSALVVSPCVTPILAGALIYVAASGDAVTGGASLFALSLGMGIPLIAAGTFGGHVLPRAGAWMRNIKVFFGVVMLGVAIWLSGRILPTTITLFLGSALAISYGTWLAFPRLSTDRYVRLGSGVAVFFIGLGVLAALPVMDDGSTVLSRHAALPPEAGHNRHTEDNWVTVTGSHALDRHLHAARTEGKPVLLDFFADWCTSCQSLEKETLTETGVMGTLNTQGYQLLKVDISDVNEDNRALMERFGIIGLPCLIFIDPTGSEIESARILGDVTPASFLTHIAERARISL